MSAASRAITPAARDRRLYLVGVYLDRLKALKAPLPFDDRRLEQMLHSKDYASLPRSAFAWPTMESAAERV